MARKKDELPDSVERIAKRGKRPLLRSPKVEKMEDEAQTRPIPVKKDPNAHKRPPEQREYHKTEMVRLVRRGYTKDQIAEMFNVTPETVRRDWREVVGVWKEDHKEEVDNAITTIRHKYAEVMREAWEAWDKSKQDHVRTTKERDGTKGSARSKSTVMREGQCGDAQYLRAILDCLKAERDLLGLNATKKVEVSGNVIDWEMLAEGIPEDGPVPDVVAERIERAVLGYDPSVGITPHNEVIDVEVENG